MVATCSRSLFPRVWCRTPTSRTASPSANAASAHYALHGDDGRGGDPHAGRPDLPGLDVLRVPPPRSSSPGRPRPPRPKPEPGMRPLDPRLMERARAVRTLLIADVGIGVVTARAGTRAGDPPGRGDRRARFDGASLSSLRTPLRRCWWSASRCAAAARVGVRGRRPAGGDQRAVGAAAWASCGVGWPTSRSRSTAPTAVSSRPPRCSGRRRSRPTSAASCRRLVLACVVPVAVIVWIVPDRRHLGGDHAADAAARAGVHDPVGTYTRSRTRERQAALDAARRPTSSTSCAACRRCARSTAAPPRPSRSPRPATTTAGHDGHAAGGVPVGRGARAGRHARGRAGRGHRGRAARRRPARAARRR